MATDQTKAWLHEVRIAVAKKLSQLHGIWREDEPLVIGPGTLAVRPAVEHDGGAGHVDIAFLLNRDRADAPVVWDCVAGGQAEDQAAAELACHIWAETTAPTVLELLTRKGEFAAHASGADGLGLAGWHSIHGPILGYGSDDAGALQQWCLDHPIVPMLRERLAPALSQGHLHGVKILLGAFGDDSIAEVRIDGSRHDPCSEALLALPWPKDPSRVARCFVLFIHGE